MVLKLQKDIITYKEEAVIMVDENLWDIITDSKYEPIFIALREGPLTARDLTKKYNQIIVDIIDNMALPSSEKKTRKMELERVEKTIYKYLNYLQKEELIVKAGKRIQTDKSGKITKTASENLYGRTAKLYFCSSDKKELKDSPDFDKVIHILGKMLSLINNLPEPSEECLSKVLLKIFNKVHQERSRIFQTYSEELAETSKNASYGILKQAINNLDVMYIILNVSEFEKELKECFGK